ncbi:MAG: class A beta-lactamase, subclass A2 [Sporocytophaga sp.]|uniref:class A beta-lactamase, subclass A2 n=1 Tax=Sporocytophaga sp. TaxID=2231183 RepID=UPI001B0757F8|nr:class A beta-lactamase, subclass A2 [Sporocytophaga sp.]MBO9703333.1 class A beta-lactamase, subclass A2 [Sporocytophaga sp.]
MINKNFTLIAALLMITTWTKGQSIEPLRSDIKAILSTKKAKVGVSIMGDNGKDTLSINGDQRFPMQSVFKFHIALTVLSQIQQGKFSLDQLVKISEEQMLPDLYSPLREKYPKGASLKISEILTYTVSQSDNVGCDVLLKLIGGPQVVENFIQEKGFKDFSVKINEEVMQRNWDMQFKNWTTPKTSNQILAFFYNNDKKTLSAAHYDFIWTIMKQTETGKNRLKGELPRGTVVAHKTGWSGTNKEGITAAVNDIGIVFLPNGRHYFISVFVTDSKEDSATSEKIIADISKIAWDYFDKKMK